MQAEMEWNQFVDHRGEHLVANMWNYLSLMISSKTFFFLLCSISEIGICRYSTRSIEAKVEEKKTPPAEKKEVCEMRKLE